MVATDSMDTTVSSIAPLLHRTVRQCQCPHLRACQATATTPTTTTTTITSTTTMPATTITAMLAILETVVAARRSSLLCDSFTNYTYRAVTVCRPVWRDRTRDTECITLLANPWTITTPAAAATTTTGCRQALPVISALVATAWEALA